MKKIKFVVLASLIAFVQLGYSGPILKKDTKKVIRKIVRGQIINTMG